MQTRAPFPLAAFDGQNLPPLLRAYFELNQLKLLYRQGWLRRGIPPERCETVAEHVFSMALLAWWTADLYLPGLDRERMLLMILAHELGEIYAGDLIPADGIAPEEKYRRERESLLRVTAGLPSGPELLALWEEFEAGETPEAVIVRQLDRLEMAFQAAVYQSGGFARMDEFYQSAAQSIDHPDLTALLDLVKKLNSKT